MVDEYSSHWDVESNHIAHDSSGAEPSLPVYYHNDEVSSIHLTPTVKIVERKQEGHIVTHHVYHDHAETTVDDCKLLSQEEKGNQSPSNIASGGTESTSSHSTPFSVKLYDMVEAIETRGLSNVISWQPHGRCFKVHEMSTFKVLVQEYFKLTKFASFQRQLNLYGFQRLTVGQDKGSYYHELFLRSRPDLACQIFRIKVKGTGVRGKTYPDEEPNLYSYPSADARATLPDTVSTASAMNMDVTLLAVEETEGDYDTNSFYIEGIEDMDVLFDTMKESSSNMEGMVHSLSSLDEFSAFGNESSKSFCSEHLQSSPICEMFRPAYSEHWVTLPVLHVSS